MRKTLAARIREDAKQPDDLPPFERFMDLTKRLVSVPKAEIDAAAKREAVKKRGATAP
ncbi:MAG TPA: hypothetical protein VKR30_08675 [Candidatus Limnocylindrales bacterium]|nr:hypothetical protein [Candidatus Limnocylindrales bacterium]